MIGTLLRVLVFAVAAYAILALLTYLFAERVMFQPPRPSYEEGTLDFRMAPVRDGESIAVLHLPNPDAEFTILHSHGNAEDLGHFVHVLEVLRRAGFHVVAYDYRGYGRSSPGPATAQRAIEDAEAAYRWTVGELGVPPERLILHGRSVGSGPTLELAVRHDAAGVVLESAFLSAFRVMTRVPLLPFDRFPNLARLHALDQPLMVIHGTRDLIIPVWHGRRLFDAADEPKVALWVEGAGHNDLAWVAGDRYATAFREFAAGAAAGR